MEAGEEQQPGLQDMPDDLVARILGLAADGDRSAWQALSQVSRRFRSIVFSPLSGAWDELWWSIYPPGYRRDEDAGSWLAQQQHMLQRFGSLMRHIYFIEDRQGEHPFEPHMPEQLLALLVPGVLQSLFLNSGADALDPALQALPRLAPSLAVLEIEGYCSALPGALLQLPQLRELKYEAGGLPDGMVPAVLALTALQSLHLECWSLEDPLPHCDQLTALQRLTYLFLKDYTHNYEGEPLLLPAPADFSPALASLLFLHNAWVEDGDGRVLQVGEARLHLLEYSRDADGSADVRIRGLRSGGQGALAAVLPPGTAELDLKLDGCELTPAMVAGVSRLAALSSLKLDCCCAPDDSDLVAAVQALLEQAPGVEHLYLGEHQQLPGNPSESLLQLVAAAPALYSLCDDEYRNSYDSSVVDGLLAACPGLCHADLCMLESDGRERLEAALAARCEAAGLDP